MTCISRRPDGCVAALDRVAQVGAVEVRVLGRLRRGLGVGEVLDALLGLEVVLDPERSPPALTHMKVWEP